MPNRFRTAITWKMTNKYHRLTHLLGKVFKSVASMVTHHRESFLDHYHGPDMRYAIDDFDNWLKWEYKAGNKIDPQDAREKLAEFLTDRDIIC